MDTLHTLSDEIHKNQAEFLDYSPINIFATTFNVAEKKPTDLSPWLGPEHITPEVDMVIIALQEVDMSVGSAIGQQSSNLLKWQAALASSLPYLKLYTSQRLMGMYLTVFIQESLEPRLSQLRLTKQATGFLNGTIGNKGGLFASFYIDATRVLVMGTHLAAHEENLPDRLSQIKQLCEKTMWSPKLSPRTLLPLQDDDTLLEAHDFVILLGDLNFRSDARIDLQMAFELATDPEPTALLPFDQLTAEMTDDGVLGSFSEQPVLFRPTFKIKPGTLHPNRKKTRKPSYTDRVLYRHPSRQLPEQAKVVTRGYRSHPLLLSDHLPVSASFTLPVATPSYPRRAKLLGRLLDAMGPQHPRMELGDECVDMGALKLNETSRRTLRVTNQGGSPGRYALLVGTEPWLQAGPRQGTIGAGESLEITVSARATPESFATGRGVRESSLVLGIENGGTYYIKVVVDLSSNVFGLSPLDLCRQRLPPSFPLSHRSPLPLPPTLYRLTAAVQAGVPLSHSAESSERDALCACLEEGAPFDEQAANAAGELLVLFCRCVRGGIVPEGIRSSFMRASIRGGRAQLLSISVQHWNIFCWVVLLMRELAGRELISAEFGARVLALSCLNDPSDSAMKGMIRWVQDKFESVDDLIRLVFDGENHELK
eukprot:gnl/Dysnectes_brevis/3516_a4462_1067.p1 GENE.gnl/Dysnectes_brevis/3516_a4462_1067~~gnl/Dysnectes_brevis/3516_a4462_1067.p1  ORF type:complete len:653 (-),score=145.94 gnl/Dysnectes_brevis/3516_a4462_1067:34-1992(-)